MKCGIYKILNLSTKKFYIGSSKSIEQRWKRHKLRLKKNYHTNPHLQSAWNKYGEDAFELNILEECSEGELLVREQYYLDTTNCTNKKIGYNIATIAGKGPDCTGLRQYHHMKQVNQYDLDGNLIKSHNCANDIETELGISNKNISGCCNGKSKSAGGFMWTHGKNPPKKIKPYKIKKVEYTSKLREKLSKIQKNLGPNKYILKNRKEISKYNLNGELLETFPYAKKASEKYGYCETALRDVTNPKKSKSLVAYGFIWRYGKNKKINVPKIKYIKRIANIEQWKNNTLIKTFKTAREAAISLNIKDTKLKSVTTMIRDCSLINKEKYDYIWKRSK